MLASKLLPEQEEERGDILKDGNRDKNIDPAHISQEKETMNGIVDRLTLGGGPLDPKGPLRIAYTASVKAAAAVVDETLTSRPPEEPDALLAAVSYGAGL